MSHQIRNRIKIDRPFAVFVFPADDVPGAWIAHVIGPNGLDNMAQGESPVQAMEMAAEMLGMVAGRCKDESPHDFSEVGLMGADFGEPIPCRVCVRCGERAHEDELEEISDREKEE